MQEPLPTAMNLPSDLQASLQSYAEKSGRSVQDVVEEALRTFLDDEDMTDIRRYHVLKAESLGLDLDDYVAKLVKEHRREKREQQAA